MLTSKCTSCKGNGNAGGSLYVYEPCQYCKGTGRVSTIDEHINQNEVLNEIQNKIRTQTAKGLEKYGHTVSVDKLKTIEWLDHTIEETIDKLVYLTCAKKSLEREGYEKH